MWVMKKKQNISVYQKAEFKCSCLLVIEGWVTYKNNRDRYDFTQARWRRLFAAQHDCGECVDKPINAVIMSFWL